MSDLTCPTCGSTNLETRPGPTYEGGKDNKYLIQVTAWRCRDCGAEGERHEGLSARDLLKKYFLVPKIGQGEVDFSGVPDMDDVAQKMLQAFQKQKTCATCRHWGNESDRQRDAQARCCYSPKYDEHTEKDDPYCQDAFLGTYGCIFHEEG